MPRFTWGRIATQFIVLRDLRLAKNSLLFDMSLQMSATKLGLEHPDLFKGGAQTARRRRSCGQ